jgi:hypothetical protein
LNILVDGNAISYVKTLNAGTDASITAMLNMTTDQYAVGLLFAVKSHSD